MLDSLLAKLGLKAQVHLLYCSRFRHMPPDWLFTAPEKCNVINQ